MKKDPRTEAVIRMLFAYQYLNVTTDPFSLGPILRSMLESQDDIGRLANATGLGHPAVIRVLNDIYSCVNRTLLYPGGKPMKTCLEIVNSTLSASFQYCMDLRSDTNALVLLVVGIFSCGILIAGSCINKRSRACVNCCYGRPAPVVPLNMLDSYENRFGNALAFGVTTSYCLNILFGNSKNVLGSRVGKAVANMPSSLNLVFKVVASFVISNAAYPLFVCMRTRYVFIGSLFGLFYCSAWLLLLVLKVYIYYYGCIRKLPARTEVLQMFEGLSDIPQFVCVVLLMAKFSVILLKNSSKKSKAWAIGMDSASDDFREEYLVKHVKNLLKPVNLRKKSGKASFKVKVKEKVYAWKPEFRYSTRVVSAFMVSGITIYTVTIQLLFLVWYANLLLDDFMTTDYFQTIILRVFPNDAKIVIDIQKHLHIWIICLYVAIVLAAIKTFVVFLNMLSWYRGHITRLRKGDKSWLPSSMKSLEASSASLMAAGMKYAGFQVAYVAWGFIVFAFVLLFLLGILASFLIYPLTQGESSYLLDLIYQALPTIALSIMVSITQMLSAKYVFLQDKQGQISVNNRNAFHITSYYMFFFNIFLGLFSCLMRIIKSILIGVLFLERVQKSLLPRSFEKMDPGYFAYIGYILVEHSHANPVLCVFFSLLKEEFKTVRKNRESTAIIVNQDFELDDVKESSQAEGISRLELDASRSRSQWYSAYDRRKNIRNKWNLFYTLVNNPSLVKLRKNYVESDDEEDDPDGVAFIATCREGSSAFYD